MDTPTVFPAHRGRETAKAAACGGGADGGREMRPASGAQREGDALRYFKSPASKRATWRPWTLLRPEALPTMYSG